MNLLKKFIGWIQRQAQPRTSDQNQLVSMFRQAESAEQRHFWRGKIAGMNRAISIWQQIIQHPDFPSQEEQFQHDVLNCSAKTYVNRYRVKKSTQDLNIALQTWRSLIMNVSPDCPELPRWFNNLGVALAEFYLHSKDLSDLEASNMAFRQAVDNTSIDSQNLALYMDNLGTGLRNRYLCLGELVDLDESIMYFRQAIEKMPSDSPNLHASLNGLALGLIERYTRLGASEDLDEAVQIFQRIVKIPLNLPNLSKNDLKKIKLETQLKIKEIETEIKSYQQNIAKIPHDFTGILSSQYEHECKSLEKKLEIFKKAAQEPSTDIHNLFSGMVNMLDNLKVLAKMDDAYQQVVSDYEQRVQQQTIDSDLQNLLCQLADKGGNVEQNIGQLATQINPMNIVFNVWQNQDINFTYFDECIDISQKIIQHSDFLKLNNDFQFNTLNLKALMCMLRYWAKGDAQDLDIALQELKSLIQKLPDDYPNLVMYLDNLGGGFHTRYLRLGELADLDAKISAYRQATEKAFHDSPDLAKYFNNLGDGLYTRYLRLEELTDLEAGIFAYRQATEKVLQDSPYLAMYFDNLGNGLRTRYLRLGKSYDLEEAIKCFQQAVKETPSDSPNLAGYLNDLGWGICDRYLKGKTESFINQIFENHNFSIHSNKFIDRLLDSGSLEDLEEAIKLFRQAIDNVHPDFPDLPVYLNGLGGVLYYRYLQLENLSDLEESIDVYRKAIRKTTHIYYTCNLATYLHNLATLLRSRYLHMENLADLEEGVKVLRQAQVIELNKKCSLESLLNTSRNFLIWAFERSNWQEMEEVYPQIQATSEQLVEKQLQREHQEAFLTETQGISAAMAYARIQLHNPAGAAEALEQGAARLLSTALARDNADISQLQQDYPDLYARYEQQRKAVKNAQRFYQNANEEQHKAAFEQWQQQEAHFQSVLSEIRQQPDQENFLKIATDINRVYQAADTRPLVYVFYTDKGGYALRVFKKEIQAIALPELNMEKLLGQIAEGIPKNDTIEAIDDLTAWLYAAIMQPIVSHLTSTEFTLIPIGYLNSLPLHLAWTEENGTRQYIVDKFTINYAPNALALVNAQQSAILPSDTLLIINEPKPVEASELPSSIMESIAIKQHFEQSTELAHEQATVYAVKEALNNTPNVLHFTCHGGANFENPLTTGLLMANNEMLTVADFFQAQLQARLVSLSACETGMIGGKQAEEVVGLPTSLLHAGAAGVLASLWSVEDASTALLMTRFYGNFMQQQQAPQAALREAQLWLREANNQEIYDWLKPVINSLRPVYRLPFHQNARNKPLDKPYQSAYYWGAFYYTGI